MSSEGQLDSIFCVEYVTENNLLAIVFKFVYLLLLRLCFLILFFCFFCLFIYLFLFLVVIFLLFFLGIFH